MFEYGNLSQAARSRVAAERFAVLAAIAEAVSYTHLTLPTTPYV